MLYDLCASDEEMVLTLSMLYQISSAYQTLFEHLFNLYDERKSKKQDIK